VNNKDNRDMFDLINKEKAEQDVYEGRIARAADRAAKGVDYQTILLFTKYGKRLPARLARIAQDSHARSCGQESVFY